MSRARQRFEAFLRASLRRVSTQLRRAVTSDEDVTRERGEGERAFAHELARSAAVLRGGMAKVAQLSAYLAAPGQAEDAEARAALAALWDDARAADPAAIRQVIEEDLGAPPEKLFAHFSDQPLAAASLGQVHAATGHDGAKLAVKVQYPGVAEALRDDLESKRLLRMLAGAAIGGALSEASIAALRDGLQGELDYVGEAQNLAGFRAAYRASRGGAGILIPRPYPELSSRRVLTMERLDGERLAAFARDASPASRADVARLLFRFAFESPLVHGLLNADPNPGNYLVDARDPSRPPRVAFLDFGCAIEIDDALYDADRALFLSLVHEDGEALRHALYREGLLGEAKVLDTHTYRAFEEQLAAPFLSRAPFTLTTSYVQSLAGLLSRLVRARGLALPAKALLLWRQRIGALSVIAMLEPTLEFRRALCDVLDDGKHPVPLSERYR